MSVCVDHRFSLIYGKNIYSYLRQVEFVNKNQECISFDQSILLVENINKRKETYKLSPF